MSQTEFEVVRMVLEPMTEEPGQESPLTRLFHFGLEALSTSELLSVVRADRQGTSRARRILAAAGGLRAVCGEHAPTLAAQSGIGKRRAAQLLASVELGRRVLCSGEIRPKLRTPSQVYRYLAPTLSALNREVFEVLCLNKRNTLIRQCRVAEGTVDSCAVDPREVFALALGARAAAIVLVHNHPSGSAEPSREDLVLNRLTNGAELLGLRLLDHLIIAEGTFVSLLERGHIPVAPTSREVAATP